MGSYEANHRIEVNGVRLHYADAGSGHPVILVHGNGESHALFETEIEQLVTAGYRVLAPDSRGHGANEPESEYHYADMTEDVFQFICALNLDKPYLYGHSDGGIIGLLLAIRHTGSLGMLACSGTNLCPEGIVPAFIEEFTAINEKNPDPLVTLMLTEPHIDPRDLERIEIPVLITVGEHDLILPEETERIVRYLPKAKLVIVPGEDHGSYIDHSEIMGKLLIEFLQENTEEERQ